MVVSWRFLLFSFQDINSLEALNFGHCDFVWMTQNSKIGKSLTCHKYLHTYEKSEMCRRASAHASKMFRVSWITSDLELSFKTDLWHSYYVPTSVWEHILLLFVFPCGPAVNCWLVQDVTLSLTEDNWDWPQQPPPLPPPPPGPSLQEKAGNRK